MILRHMQAVTGWPQERLLTTVNRPPSLNRHLLQGSDLTNSLVGILCRFRQDKVAVTCDIEGMFHQVRVNEERRDNPRFLWWDKGDTTKEPEEYRTRVHLFGATSSPGLQNLP